MASSLSNHVNNLAERIHKINPKYGDYDKICETCGIKYKYVLNIRTLKII